MAQDFMAALKAEIAELEAELSADVRFVRLHHLRKTLALYVDPEAVAAEMQMLGARVLSPGKAQSSFSTTTQYTGALAKELNGRASGRRASAEKTQALDAAALHVSNRSGPVTTREILDHLNDLGIEVGGSSPLNNLSAMLSNSDRFVSHGRSGWTLETEETDEDRELWAMDQTASEFVDSLTDEGLLQLKTEIVESEKIPVDVIARLKTGYIDITGKDYVVDGRNRFKDALLYHIDSQINDRSEAFVRSNN